MQISGSMMWVESMKPSVISSQKNMNSIWNESDKLRDIEGFIEGERKEELDWSVSKVPGKLNTTICCCCVDNEKTIIIFSLTI